MKEKVQMKVNETRKIGNAPKRSGPSTPEPSMPDAAEGQPAANAGLASAAEGVLAEGNGFDLGGAAGLGFPKVDLDRTMEFLANGSDSKRRFTLKDLLLAGVTTGLQPEEWRSTQVDIQEAESAPSGCLILLNVFEPTAVGKDGKGIRRTVDISAFQEETVQAILRASEHGNAWHQRRDFTENMTWCSYLLQIACGEVFNSGGSGPRKLFTLGSLRRQFVANVSSFKNLDEAGTLAGCRLSKDRSEIAAKFGAAWDATDMLDMASALKADVKAHRKANRGQDRRLAASAKNDAAKRDPNRQSPGNA